MCQQIIIYARLHEMEPTSYSLGCKLPLVAGGAERGRSEVAWLRGGEAGKRSVVSSSLALRSLALGKPSCHVTRTVQQPYGEAHVTTAGERTIHEAGPLVLGKLSDDCNPH